MSFKDYLQNTAKEIDNELDVFFQEFRSDIERVSPRLLPFVEDFADACRGGKRIRGSLVVLGYEMSQKGTSLTRGLSTSRGRFFEGSGRGNKLEVKSGILKVAVAYEIFQAAILAHDDIIDRSKFRRGKLSLYAKLGGDHLGESLAICLGDIGFFLAFKMIARSRFDEGKKNRIFEIFSDMAFDTSIGELLDVDLGVRAEEAADITDVIAVYEFKTAYYTIAAPLLMGGVLGGLDDNKLVAIRKYGQNLGIAFQIQDDINDIFSDKKRLGKDIGGDIKEGKRTLLYVYAKKNSNRRQREILEKYYGDSQIGQEEIGEVKEVLSETGALKYAQAETNRYSKTAKGFVSEITGNEAFRKMFVEMVEYFGSREL